MSDRRIRRSRSGRVVSGVTEALGKAVTAPQTVRERLNRALLPLAWGVGILGAVALILCGALYLLPEERWPEALDEDLFPVYVTVSVAAASLLGWGCMQDGLAAMRRRVGWQVGGWLFVLLPLACAVVGLLAAKEVVEPTGWPGGAWLAPAVRYYPPFLVAAALLAHVGGRVRRRERGEPRTRGALRGGVALAQTLPYVLLIALLVLGLEPPEGTEDLGEAVHESFEDTSSVLGGWAVVLQVVLAYFVGSSAAP